MILEYSYIKVLRKLTEWEWYNDSKMVHIFLHLLLSANHTKNTWRGIPIERGQLVTGRNSLSKSTGISEATVRTCLERLRSTNEVTIKSTSQYSIITVCKYDTYQSFEKKITKQSTSKSTSKSTNNQPATNQRPTTNNNDNNEKNENNIYRSFAHLEISHEEIEKLKANYSIEEIDKMIDNVQNSKTNTKYVSLYLTVKNWLGREYGMRNLTKQQGNKFTEQQIKTANMWITSGMGLHPDFTEADRHLLTQI